MVDTVTPALIGGAVLCWGRITIHAEGIRAEFARPLALCFPETVVMVPGPRVLIKLMQAYRAPLLEESRLAVYADEFGGSLEPETDPSGWSTRLRRSLGDFLRW